MNSKPCCEETAMGENGGPTGRLTIKRIIKAKRERVFEAWTRPEMMKRWFAPGEMTVPSAHADVRIGGSYTLEMEGEMDGMLTNPTVSGTYQKIVPNELLSFTWAWKGDTASATLVTVEFRDVDGGTEVTLTHEGFDAPEARDKHDHGWQGCLVNLAKRLE
jgi:uncharacterized protein YndB with AHSA1/START domain